MFALPTEILNIILDNISSSNDIINFLEYIKHANYHKYLEIIYSINMKLQHKYKILGKIEEIYKNIKISNKMEKYMLYKSEIYELYINLDIQTMFFCNKLIEILNNSLYDPKQKKRFTNICSKLIIKDNYYMKQMVSINNFYPKISIKNTDIYLKMYIDITQNLLKIKQN